MGLLCWRPLHRSLFCSHTTILKVRHWLRLLSYCSSLYFHTVGHPEAGNCVETFRGLGQKYPCVPLALPSKCFNNRSLIYCELSTLANKSILLGSTSPVVPIGARSLVETRATKKNEFKMLNRARRRFANWTCSSFWEKSRHRPTTSTSKAWPLRRCCVPRDKSR